MTEAQWVEAMATALRKDLPVGASLRVVTGLKLAYGYEIDSYPETTDGQPTARASKFQTDLAIVEMLSDGWKPRVVIEAKLRRVTTHDAITYSHKANIHRAVHPYLRYGIMLGNRGEYPLPGRLYRHGAQFDFMISFVGHRMAEGERRTFGELLNSEIEASRCLEKLLYESRSSKRERYTVLHRRLAVK